MLVFLKAASPWIAMGLAIALFAANHINQKKSATRKNDADEPDENEKQDNRISEGMCIGMSLGVLIGTTGVCDLATGISLGVLLGMVIGMMMKK